MAKQTGHMNDEEVVNSSGGDREKSMTEAHLMGDTERASMRRAQMANTSATDKKNKR